MVPGPSSVPAVSAALSSEPAPPGTPKSATPSEAAGELPTWTPSSSSREEAVLTATSFSALGLGAAAFPSLLESVVGTGIATVLEAAGGMETEVVAIVTVPGRPLPVGADGGVALVSLATGAVGTPKGALGIVAVLLDGGVALVSLATGAVGMPKGALGIVAALLVSPLFPASNLKVLPGANTKGFPPTDALAVDAEGAPNVKGEDLVELGWTDMELDRVLGWNIVNRFWPRWKGATDDEAIAAPEAGGIGLGFE